MCGPLNLNSASFSVKLLILNCTNAEINSSAAKWQTHTSFFYRNNRRTEAASMYKVRYLSLVIWSKDFHLLFSVYSMSLFAINRYHSIGKSERKILRPWRLPDAVFHVYNKPATNKNMWTLKKKNAGVWVESGPCIIMLFHQSNTVDIFTWSDNVYEIDCPRD